MPRTRLFALLLVLLIFPCQAFGEHTVFTARFFTGDALPAEMKESLYALTFEGDLKTDGELFDLRADMLMYGGESTRTSLHLYGTEKIASFDSSLLGDTTLMLNMPAAMEFAIKADRHFNIPLQNVAILIPYVTKDALTRAAEVWNAVLHQSNGSRTVSRDELIDLAYQLYDLTYGDRALIYWLSGLDTLCDLPTAIDEYLLALPDALAETLPEEGVVIAATEDGETWTAGGETILERAQGVLRVRAPRLAGRTLSLDFRDNADGVALDFVFGGESGDILRVRLDADAMPVSLAAQGEFSARLTLSGGATETPVDLSLRYTVGADDAFTATLENDGRLLLRAEGTVQKAAHESLPYTERAMIDNGLNFFSLSDVTLADFAASVKDPLLAGAVPLILRAPTEVTVSLIRMLLESGAMDMLAPEGGKLSSLLRFLLTPFGGVCLTIVRTCVVAPLPVFAVFVLLIAAVVFGVKKGRAQKRAANAPKKGETE